MLYKCDVNIMERFAIIKTGGKQYQVKEGDTLKVEKLDTQAGQKMRFDQVLLHYDEQSGVRLGEPFLEGEVVEAEVLEEVKGEKIVVFTYKPKKHEKKKKGHRQRYTLVKIVKVGKETKERQKERMKSESKPKAEKRRTPPFSRQPGKSKKST